MPKVNVKWSGKQFEVDANTDLEPLVFKSQLFELTGVVPERQKVVIKVSLCNADSELAVQGKTLPDDSWNGVSVSEGAMMMMLGSVGEVPKHVVETSSEGGKAEQNGEKKVILPTGLNNLGNTCYMNATLQSFLVRSSSCCTMFSFRPFPSWWRACSAGATRARRRRATTRPSRPTPPPSAACSAT